MARQSIPVGPASQGPSHFSPGIAIEARTIPGRQATFATWRSDSSARIDSISRSSAKTRPGTFIAP